ncbi:MAG: hypothetical protein EOO39_12620 [Cytophagaceae bacterium]|nr:MAG: hypothetical protein EOO39_12620 [Cytophagaceae bacterium]
MLQPRVFDPGTDMTPLRGAGKLFASLSPPKAGQQASRPYGAVKPGSIRELSPVEKNAQH